MKIEPYLITDGPPSAYYIPNFITSEEEKHILNNFYSVPKPKWTYLSNRRLQDYGGVPSEKGMIPEKIPNWLNIYMNKIHDLNLFEGKTPNQVLMNEYEPGQGIMPHTDGPLFYPTIATISCSSHTVLEFLENNESRKVLCKVLLEPLSLVIVKDDLYSKYLHSISEKKLDTLAEDCVNLPLCGTKRNIGDVLERSTRVSLTIRNVPKVLKIKLF